MTGGYVLAVAFVAVLRFIKSHSQTVVELSVFSGIHQ